MQILALIFILKQRTRVFRGFEASKRVKVGLFKLRFFLFLFFFKSNLYAAMS